MDLGVGDVAASATTPCRIVKDYIIGPKIGSGSFAVVWRSKHRHLGTEFAIKEIDKKHLNDNLLKEISILRNISHPNIIRLFEAIETEDRVYLVLEYCDGGDLGDYIRRHGRVSEDVARHFMKQLAAGLQVLRENHLIHRDLKPQNLLLSGKEPTPLLKIGDFGFARYLNSQGLADTLCGSPLYMAPEIIQNQKYDAKADLWSVGAILYQLVIGKPPFEGKNQLQLFQNILTSIEPRFPEGALKFLHPDCVQLCRSLLRRNPVERITFEEFFSHRFLVDDRVAVDVQLSSQIARVESLVLTDDQRPQLHQEVKLKAEEGVKGNSSFGDDEKREFRRDHGAVSSSIAFGVMPNASKPQLHQEDKSRASEGVKQDYSSVDDPNTGFRKDHGAASSTKDVCGAMSHSSIDKVGQSVNSQSSVAGSSESIERGYVLVHSNFASMEILTSSLGTSRKDNSITKACALAPKHHEQMPTSPELKELATKFGAGAENISWSGMGPSRTSDAPYVPREAQGQSVLHPSTRLQLLHQYVGALSDLASEKLIANALLESFSIELVVLAIWKVALQICSSWMSSSGRIYPPENLSGNEIASRGGVGSSEAEDATDFKEPSSVSTWAEQGFIMACDRTEKLSKYLQDVDGAAEMPDAMEIIFQTALAAGRNGAADQLLGNQDSAATIYSRALLLFSFIVAEAPSLPLNPPFVLAPDSKQRILKYVKNLELHLGDSQSQMLQPSLKQLSGSITK